MVGVTVVRVQYDDFCFYHFTIINDTVLQKHILSLEISSGKASTRPTVCHVLGVLFASILRLSVLIANQRQVR